VFSNIPSNIPPNIPGPSHNASLGSLKKALFVKKLFEKKSKILINKIEKRARGHALALARAGQLASPS
jgi:hypothetical protein